MYHSVKVIQIIFVSKLREKAEGHGYIRTVASRREKKTQAVLFGKTECARGRMGNG